MVGKGEKGAHGHGHWAHEANAEPRPGVANGQRARVGAIDDAARKGGDGLPVVPQHLHREPHGDTAGPHGNARRLQVDIDIDQAARPVKELLEWVIVAVKGVRAIRDEDFVGRARDVGERNARGGPIDNGLGGRVGEDRVAVRDVGPDDFNDGLIVVAGLPRR